MCSKSHINYLLLPKFSVRVITLRQGWALCPVFLTKRDLQKKNNGKKDLHCIRPISSPFVYQMQSCYGYSDKRGAYK